MSVQENQLVIFKQTSDKLYDRHNYKVVYDGGESPVFTDYEIMRAYWFHHHAMLSNPTVEVIDIKQKKQRGKGF